MPDPRGRGKGDLLVVVNWKCPNRFRRRQEQLLRELAGEEKTNVSPHRKSFLEKLKDYFVPAAESPPEEAPREKKRG